MEFIIGATLVGAVVGAATGLTDSIVGDTEAWHDLEEQLKNIEKMYTLEKERVEEEWKAAKETAEKNAAYAQQQADISDIGQDIKETATSLDFNAAVDNLYLSQIEDAMTWNAQSRAIGQAQGAGLASLGASGIRAGSSLSQAVELEAATNEAQLQFSQDAKRTQDSNNLGMMLNNLAGVKYDIYGNRVEADVTREQATDLYNSYQEGGHNYNLYKNKLDTLQQQYNYNKKVIEREQDRHSGWNAFWNGVKSFFTFGAAGAQTGYNLASMGVELGGYTKEISATKKLNNNTTKAIGMR